MVALCAAPAAGDAVEMGNAQHGQTLARQICASCHAVEPKEEFSPDLRAPTFDEIANNPGTTETALSAFFRGSHRSMPNFILKPDEISNITAYILSLKTSRFGSPPSALGGQ
jgi:mono/diheme cytochrome c family protein